MAERPQKTSAELARTRYFTQIATRNLSVFRYSREGHLLRRFPRDKDAARNIANHELVQGAVGAQLARLLGLPEESVRDIERAGLGHDGRKLKQSQGLREINVMVERGELTEEEGGRLKYDFFDRSEEFSVRTMKRRHKRRAPLSREVIRIATADGHTGLQRMMDPKCTIEEKINHYVGSIMIDVPDPNDPKNFNKNKADIDLLEERISALERNPRYKMMNEYGKQLEWTDGKTLYQVQRAVGHRIEEEFVSMLLAGNRLDPTERFLLNESPANLPKVIRGRIDASILRNQILNSHLPG